MIWRTFLLLFNIWTTGWAYHVEPFNPILFIALLACLMFAAWVVWQSIFRTDFYVKD